MVRDGDMGGGSEGVDLVTSTVVAGSVPLPVLPAVAAPFFSSAISSSLADSS